MVIKFFLENQCEARIMARLRAFKKPEVFFASSTEDTETLYVPSVHRVPFTRCFPEARELRALKNVPIFWGTLKKSRRIAEHVSACAHAMGAHAAAYLGDREHGKIDEFCVDGIPFAGYRGWDADMSTSLLDICEDQYRISLKRFLAGVDAVVDLPPLNLDRLFAAEQL